MFAALVWSDLVWSGLVWSGLVCREDGKVYVRWVGPRGRWSRRECSCELDPECVFCRQDCFGVETRTHEAVWV